MTGRKLILSFRLGKAFAFTVNVGQSHLIPMSQIYNVFTAQYRLKRSQNIKLLIVAHYQD